MPGLIIAAPRHYQHNALLLNKLSSFLPQHESVLGPQSKLPPTSLFLWCCDLFAPAQKWHDAAEAAWISSPLRGGNRQRLPALVRSLPTVTVTPNAETLTRIVKQRGTSHLLRRVVRRLRVPVLRRVEVRRAELLRVLAVRRAPTRFAAFRRNTRRRFREALLQLT